MALVTSRIAASGRVFSPALPTWLQHPSTSIPAIVTRDFSKTPTLTHPIDPATIPSKPNNTELPLFHNFRMQDLHKIKKELHHYQSRHPGSNIDSFFEHKDLSEFIRPLDDMQYSPFTPEEKRYLEYSSKAQEALKNFIIGQLAPTIKTTKDLTLPEKLTFGQIVQEKINAVAGDPVETKDIHAKALEALKIQRIDGHNQKPNIKKEDWTNQYNALTSKHINSYYNDYQVSELPVNNFLSGLQLLKHIPNYDEIEASNVKKYYNELITLIRIEFALIATESLINNYQPNKDINIEEEFANLLHKYVPDMQTKMLYVQSLLDHSDANIMDLVEIFKMLAHETINEIIHPNYKTQISRDIFDGYTQFTNPVTAPPTQQQKNKTTTVLPVVNSITGTNIHRDFSTTTKLRRSARDIINVPLQLSWVIKEIGLENYLNIISAYEISKQKQNNTNIDNSQVSIDIKPFIPNNKQHHARRITEYLTNILQQANSEQKYQLQPKNNDQATYKYEEYSKNHSSSTATQLSFSIKFLTEKLGVGQLNNIIIQAKEYAQKHDNNLGGFSIESLDIKSPPREITDEHANMSEDQQIAQTIKWFKEDDKNAIETLPLIQKDLSHVLGVLSSSLSETKASAIPFMI